MGREDELLARFRDDGHAASMEELVVRTRPRLVRVARRIGAPQDAEDSAQAAYHALLRREERPDDVVGWLVATVVRVAYRRKAAERREAAIAERLATPREDADAARGAARGEEDSLVRAAVHRLPARYRDAVVLHHLEGLPLADVARLLDVPEATAKTRVQRGRALLRWRLAPVVAYGFLFVPWLVLDGLDAVAAKPASLVGGVMKTKLAVAAVVLVAFGLGTAVGVVATTPPTAEVAAAAPPAAPAREPAQAPRDEAQREPAPQDAPVRTDRPRRAEAPAFTLDDVRKVVREELGRRDKAESDPEPPAAADPTLNADPAQRRSVADAVAGARKAFIEHDLRYKLGPGHEIAPPDPTRMDSYPGDAWPSNPLGWIEKRADRYEVLDKSGTGFQASRGQGAFAFTGALAKPIVSEQQQSLLFLDGVADTGVVTMQSYGSVQCVGTMSGKLVFDSYATAIFERDVAGSLTTNSYASLLVRGAMSGSIVTKSYANITLLGGFTGTMDLYDSAAVYFGGYVPQSALDRVKTSGRATFVFEATDLPPGKHADKTRNRTITVLERK